MNKKIKFIITAFLCLALACIGKVLYLQTVKKNFLLTRAEKQRANPVPIDATRGDITTADGSILATSVPTYNVYSDTRYIKDKEGAAKVVAEFFKLDEKEVLNKINSRYYIELVKQVSKEDIDEFKKIKPTGIGYYETTTRVYPNDGLLGSILGFVGNEGKGLSGLELSLNTYLAGKDGVNHAERDKHGNTISYNQNDIENPIDGSNATLTVNYDIQYKMQKEIQEAVETYGAKSGLAISINPQDGSILGIAEYPTLNPNNYKDFDQSLYKSLALNLTYEPGSTFKPLTVAIADALGVVDIEHEVFMDSGSYYIGRHRIGNWGKKAFGPQTAREILMNSSNVGTVQIAMKIPSNEFDSYLKKFGFGSKTGIELSGEQNSIMFSSSQLENAINKATNSFGQGIAVTPLQLLKAWSTIVNGGYSVNPHILKEVVDTNNNLIYSSIDKTSNLEQIIPYSTSEKVRKMLQAVVDDGTGKKAKIPGYTVGGKTGTAQVVENGKYVDNKYRVSFIGFSPVENPQIMTLVLLDSPEGKASGGSMCAPSVKNIMEYALNRLGIEPIFSENSTSSNSVNTDEIEDEEDVEEELTGSEISIEDYKFRLKSYVLNNKPSIPYEFEGDGDIIINQHYVTDDNITKVIFTTDSVVKDDYLITPNLEGTYPSDFMSIFNDISDKVIINGSLQNSVSVQENKPGSNVDLKTDKIILWTE